MRPLLGSAALKVLLAVLEAAHHGRTPTHRELNVRLGWKGRSYVGELLRQLRDEGLVTFEDAPGAGVRYMGTRTVRPTCRLVVYRGKEAGTDG